MPSADVSLAAKQRPEAPLQRDSLPGIVNRHQRLSGLLIVLAVAVLPLVVSSVLILSGLNLPYSGPALRFRYLNGLVMEISSLALLWYVLHQNHQKFSDIGLSFRFADIGHAALLVFGSVICYRLSYLAIMRIHNLLMGRSPAPPFIPATGLGITLFTLIFVLVNPIFEELIARAFVTSEIVALTGSSFLAIAASVTIQTVYHLYQGVPYALALGVVFFVFSIYYLRTRRILPVILAHLWFDLSALIVFPLLRLANS